MNWIGIVIAAVVVGFLAWMMRRAGTRDEATLPPPVPEVEVDDQPLTPDPVDIEEEDDESAGMIAMTSDGLAFVPRDHGVLITPARRIHASPSGAIGDDVLMLPANPGAAHEHQVTVMLKPGDLIAARVRKGSPDLDPWRLETLGRDRDLTAWVFEVPEAAEAARELLAEDIVQPPRDEHGDPIPVGDEDFWVAERELEQTFADLDIPDPIDEDETPRTP